MYDKIVDKIKRFGSVLIEVYASYDSELNPNSEFSMLIFRETFIDEMEALSIAEKYAFSDAYVYICSPN